MSLTALAIFSLALLIDSGSPGPTVAALISRVLTNGFRDVVPFLAAIWLGEALWLTVAVTGLAVVAQTFGVVFLALKYAGVAYLLYLAWGMWHAPARPIAEGGVPKRRSLGMFSAGLLVSIGNPKNMVFYLALLPAIIDLDHITVAGWAELVATMLVTLAAVDLTWSAAAVQARRLLRSGPAMRIANKVSASVMAGTAAVVAAR